MPFIARTRLFALIFVMFPSVARAGDWYVDAANGSNTNDGKSPLTAWKTITYAVAAVPPGVQTMHLAAGTYSPASGETIPIRPGLGQILEGPAGASKTVIDGGGAPWVPVVWFDNYSGTANPDAGGLRHLTLQNGYIGFRVQAEWGECNGFADDVEITQFSSACVEVLTGPYQDSVALVDLNHVCTDSAHVGVGASASSFYGQPAITYVLARDCIFSGHDMGGVAYAGDGWVYGWVDRCKLMNNTGDGARIETYSGTYSFEMSDCLVAENAGAGIRGGFTSNYGSSADFSIKRSTIVNNGQEGVRVASPGGSAAIALGVSSSILWLNHDDLYINVPPSISETLSNNDIQDGDQAGVSGNFSSDPKFRNVGASDYRLVYGSPCIDLVPPPDINDIDGHPHKYDGNLDTLQLSDLGAYEFETLELVVGASPGGTAQLAVFGSAGARAAVFATRGGPVANPSWTSAGQLDLDTAHMFRYATVDAQSHPPGGIVNIPIPNKPALSGRSFTFQAAIVSTSAPFSAAWSNSVVLTIGN
ncbi:MAG: DUF1565 domain-containing protein [Planctomycetes bacterium]|nr:DUF1565 domain-containing protein [Planctomycetota bacterium]